MKQRGGQFYLFDAFFAATILLLGIGFLVADYTSTPGQAQTQILVNDVTSALTSTQLGEVFNDYTVEHFEILNEEYTPAQQIHSWWYNQSCTWCQDNATALINSVLSPIGEDQHGIQVIIANQTTEQLLFERTLNRERELLIVNHQVLVTDYQDKILGPDNLEVRVWR